MRYLVGLVRWQDDRVWVQRLLMNEKEDSTCLGDSDVELLKLRQISKMAGKFDLADRARTHLLDDGVLEITDHRNYSEVFADTDRLEILYGDCV